MSHPATPRSAPAPPRRGVHHLALRLVIRVVVTIVGSAVTLVGVVLLVAPGPGFVFIAGGLAILATQYPVLRGPLHRAKVLAQRGVDEMAEKWWRTAIAVGTGVGMVALGVLPFVGVEIPYLTRLGGGMIGVSGLFLVGLVVYARRTGGISHPDGELARQDVANPAQPATAQPATAQPANPQPANPQPANPQPAKPQPSTAQPSTPRRS